MDITLILLISTVVITSILAITAFTLYMIKSCDTVTCEECEETKVCEDCEECIIATSKYPTDLEIIDNINSAIESYSLGFTIPFVDVDINLQRVTIVPQDSNNTIFPFVMDESIGIIPENDDIIYTEVEVLYDVEIDVDNSFSIIWAIIEYQYNTEEPWQAYDGSTIEWNSGDGKLLIDSVEVGDIVNGSVFGVRYDVKNKKIGVSLNGGEFVESDAMGLPDFPNFRFKTICSSIYTATGDNSVTINWNVGNNFIYNYSGYKGLNGKKYIKD